MHAIPAKGRPHEVAVLVYDGVTPFELGVACDIFGSSYTAELDVPWYRLSVCAARPGSISVGDGLSVQASYGLSRARRADTIIVLPTERPDEVSDDVLDLLRRAHGRGRRIVSLCTGAFVLARAGLLDGRNATTHWTDCAELARRFPRVRVDPDVLFIDDGDILTSAGSAAGIDLCLHLIRADFGADVANQIARQLVVPPQRDGGQAQYIDLPIRAGDELALFSETIDWLQSHLAATVTIDELARRSAMSPRTFARRFLATTGTTPYQWLVRERVKLAQRLLETTNHDIEQVAVTSGFATGDNLRKHFKRVVRCSPHAYRRSFAQR